MNCDVNGCEIDHTDQRCRTPECGRAVMRSSGGTSSPWCETCVRFHLTQAFAPVSPWVQRAREGTLPTRIEGGVKA